MICFRAYLGYHTVQQVAIGCLVGTAFGIVWYFLLEYYVRPRGYVDIFIKSSPCQWLKIRDSRQIPNIVAFEYANIMKTLESADSKKLE